MVEAEIRSLFGEPTGKIPSQLRPLVNALLDADRPRSVLVWLRRSPTIRLLADLAVREDPISHQLLDQLPNSAVLPYVRSVLVETGVLPKRIEYLERLEPWLAAALESRSPAQAALIRPYAQWFLFRRARQKAERTGHFDASSAARLRGLVRSTFDLLDWLDDRDIAVAAMRQQHVDARYVTIATGSTCRRNPRLPLHRSTRAVHSDARDGASTRLTRTGQILEGVDSADQKHPGKGAALTAHCRGPLGREMSPRSPTGRRS